MVWAGRPNPHANRVRSQFGIRVLAIQSDVSFHFRCLVPSSSSFDVTDRCGLWLNPAMPGGMKKWRGLAVTIFLAFIINPSALSRPVPAAWQPAPMKRSVTNHWQTVIVTPKPGLPEIHFYDKVNPVWWFGNIDDPAPPAWYRPDSAQRDFLWHLRNPFHNIDH